MASLDQQRGRYRVLLIGIGNNTEADKDFFCNRISNNYGVPSPQIRKIVDRCPVILKKDLSLKKAALLARTFRSFGALVSVEKKEEVPAIVLEFQEFVPHRLALESCSLQKSRIGTRSVTGRAKNISDETLSDIWVVVQVFDDFEEFVAFEEIPLAINPLPSGQTSPFRVIFEGPLSFKRILVAFKNASGQPVSAVDKRRKREWVKADEEESPHSSLEMPMDLKEKAEVDPMVGPLEKTVVKRGDEIPGDILLSPEPEVAPLLEYGLGENYRDAERVSEESLLQPFEPLKEPMESTPISAKGDDSPRGQEPENALGGEIPEGSILFGSEKVGEKINVALSNTELASVEEKWTEQSEGDPSVFQEATQLPRNISEKPEEGKVEEEVVALSLSWMEHFRDAVRTFYQAHYDIFSNWFVECRKRGEFKNALHSLLTVLTHSRFNQGSQSLAALENTQELFRLIVQPNLLPDEIPPLNGTSFASGENWRDLFQRAFPKVRQIGNAILEKDQWRVYDLERLIRVIPQMGIQNSRMAIQWIGELLPDVVKIDFSNATVIVGEELYRVAARLGIVDPVQDYYHGTNSMGFTKIQSFAREVFPYNPIQVEKPMTWMGDREDQGGHCFPIQPRCDGCLFKTFCPRLCLDFNPSEKGMRD